MRLIELLEPLTEALKQEDLVIFQKPYRCVPWRLLCGQRRLNWESRSAIPFLDLVRAQRENGTAQ
jgi:hypothetical protein